MASAPTDSAAPRAVIAGRFQIKRLIGEGAFAHVYQARDLMSGTDVAVKVLKESLRSDAEILERFRREVYAVASIDSPHVVRMHDFGISGDDVFIAMEYVEGPVLRDLLGGKPLSPDAAHIVVGQIAQAVAAAHDKGVIHRDLKPENVVLVRGTRGRQVKVLDFGLAKMAELEQQLGLQPLTRDGMCFGTPQYMSPEQIQGRSAERSGDLWAVSVIAYEIITGHLPWDGEDPRDVFYSVLSKTLPPVAAAHRSLVRIDEINRFFARALSRRPEERPADAAELFGAFEQALFGGPHAPAAKVFSGIISAEFALPTVDEKAMTEPGDPAAHDAEAAAALMAVTPDTTQPGTRRSSGKRKLRSVWNAPVGGSLPSLSDTGPGEAARLAPAPLADEPLPAGKTEPSLPALDVEAARELASEAALTVERAPKMQAAQQPSVPSRAPEPSASATNARRGIGTALLVVLALLLVVAGVAGYLYGHAHR